MLNIQPVNFIRNINYRNNYVNSVSYPKLRPLAQDTVSFTGARNLNHSLMEAFDNEALCEEIYDNAHVCEDNLQSILKMALWDYMAANENSEGLVGSINVRRKTPESIREKATSKFEDAIMRNKVEDFVNLKDRKGIKKLVQDIVGARVILNQADQNENAKIIDRLIKLVQSGALKIKGIERIMPSEALDLKPYFSDDDLDRLEQAVNEQKQDGSEIEWKSSETKSGYCALHIDIDLSDDNLPLRNAGYSGEIQIMGQDIAYFKDLEDLCYKTKQGKEICANHPAYHAFSAHLNRFLGDKEKHSAIREKFDYYTYIAYLTQRSKDPNQEGYDREHLPSLEECGMADKLPKELDFNYLQKIKKNCDELYRLTYQKR